MSILKVSIFLLAVIVLGIFLLITRYEPAQIRLSDRPDTLNPLPIGEITRAFRAEQLLTADFFSKQGQIGDGSTVCIKLLLANWSNRKNTGYFAVDLIINKKEVFTSVIDASTVSNNTNRTICYDELSISKLIEQNDVRLVLRGISSPPGAAITAWTTTDLSAGQLINVSESFESRSLVFHLSSKQESKIMYRHALIILILNMLAIATLIIPAKVCRKDNMLITKGNLK